MGIPVYNIHIHQHSFCILKKLIYHLKSFLLLSPFEHKHIFGIDRTDCGFELPLFKPYTGLQAEKQVFGRHGTPCKWTHHTDPCVLFASQETFLTNNQSQPSTWFCMLSLKLLPPSKRGCEHIFAQWFWSRPVERDFIIGLSAEAKRKEKKVWTFSFICQQLAAADESSVFPPPTGLCIAGAQVLKQGPSSPPP